MAYKYSSPTFFVNTKDMTSYTCYSQDTSYGFRHIAFKGIVTNPTIRKPDANAHITIGLGSVGDMKVYYLI